MSVLYIDVYIYLLSTLNIIISSFFVTNAQDLDNPLFKANEDISEYPKSAIVMDISAVFSGVHIAIFLKEEVSQS